ncbi:SdpI family protein [Halalkalibacillus sediminis]|uniref:SdpI family protein n=1 Tax=Halalkalibacillus sediminis TaxID=2018042 RepID=UPI0013901F0F|nr:SdpI family protein [Halalkalibacillus sediminis]
MNSKKVSLSVITLAIISCLIAYPFLPEQVAIHWSNGEADNFGNKNWATFLIPVIMVLSFFLMNLYVKSNDLKAQNQKNSPILMNAFNLYMIFLFMIHLMTIAFGLGVEFSINMFVGLLVGSVSIGIANPMPKLKPNHIYGLRTPWTLKDERVWKKSNRFASKLLVIIGIIIIILTFIFPEHITPISLGLLIVVTVISIIHSYLTYKEVAT